MKLNAAELARIVEHKRAITLKQDKMIVFGGREIGRFNRKLARHPEMHAEPCVARKTKEHAFAMAFRAEKFCADESLLQFGRIDAARDAFLFIDVNAYDRLS